MDNRQLQALRQPTRQLETKLTLYDDKDNIVMIITGAVIGGNISVSNQSSYRRSGNIVVANTNDKFIPHQDSYVWFNKRLKIEIGILNYNNEIIWFNLGHFVYTQCNITDSIDSIIISLELADYMSLLDGSLGGQITSKIKIIEKNTPFNQAVSGILNGLCKYSIEKPVIKGKEAILPYRIEKDAGTTVYDLLKEINDLYLGYEMYFDLDGFFIFKKINNGKNDEYIWDFDEINFNINENKSIDFSSIKNDFWIYGYTDKYGVQTIVNYTNKYSRKDISDLANIQNKSKNDIAYIVNQDKSYIYNGANWIELDFNVVPLFNVENIGYKSEVYNDNAVVTQEQASLNLEYHIFKQGRFAENISFTCVPLFNLDVNKKIKLNNEDYLINTIEIPLSYDGEMSVTASKILY